MTCRVDIEPSMLESLSVRRYAQKGDPPGADTFPPRIPQSFNLQTKAKPNDSLEFIIGNESFFVNSTENRTLVKADSPTGDLEVIACPPEKPTTFDVFYLKIHLMETSHLEKDNPKYRDTNVMHIAYSPMRPSRVGKVARKIHAAGTKTKEVLGKVRKSKRLRRLNPKGITRLVKI